jgi:DNA repair exonuclease SbcCD ATPase subunit
MSWQPLTAESIGATEDAIVALLGFNRATFRASSLLTDSADRVTFCEASPKDRLDHLIEIANVSVYEQLLELARADKRREAQELDKRAGRIEQANAELAGRALVIRDVGHAKDREADAKKDLASADRVLAEATAKLQAAREAQAAHTAAQDLAEAKRTALEQARGRVEDLNAQETQIREQLAGKPELAEKAASVAALEARCTEIRAAAETYREAVAARSRALDDRNTLRTQVEDIQAQILTLREQADKERATARALAEQDAPLCNECGQPVTDEEATRQIGKHLVASEDATRAAEAKAAALAGLEQQLSGFDALASAEPPAPPAPIGNAEADLRLAQRARESLAALVEREARLIELAAEQEKLRAGLPALEAAHTEARATADSLATVDVDALTATQDGARENVTEKRAALQTAAEARTRLARDLERLDTVALELAAAQAETTRLHAALDISTRCEQLCSRNGLPAFVIENRIVPTLELHAQDALAELGGKLAGAQVQLRTQKVLADGGLRDTLDVMIVLPDGVERDYRRCSRGERTRVDLAMQRAFQKLLASWGGVDAGLFCLDEPAGLDADGKAALLRWVREAHEAGVSRVYLSSHDADLRDAFETTVEIVIDGAGSRIVTAATAELEGAAA